VNFACFCFSCSPLFSVERASCKFWNEILQALIDASTPASGGCRNDGTVEVCIAVWPDGDVYTDLRIDPGWQACKIGLAQYLVGVPLFTVSAFFPNCYHSGFYHLNYVQGSPHNDGNIVWYGQACYQTIPNEGAPQYG